VGTNAVGDSILETHIEGWLRFKIVNAEMVAIPGEENKVVCFILQDSKLLIHSDLLYLAIRENWLSPSFSKTKGVCLKKIPLFKMIYHRRLLMMKQ